MSDILRQLGLFKGCVKEYRMEGIYPSENQINVLLYQDVGPEYGA